MTPSASTSPIDREDNILFAPNHHQLGKLASWAVSAQQSGCDRFAEADLYRVRGELLRSGSDDATAEGCLIQAVAIAQKQSAKFWELRAAISLARLWSEQGRRDAARDLLTPIYGWFAEGFDTPVLKEAKALLAAL